MGLGSWSFDRQLDTAPMSALAARITTASWTQHDQPIHLRLYTSIYVFDRF